MKINNMNKILWTISLVSLLFSCTEKIDVSLGNHEEKLIIECYIDDYENKAVGIFSMSKPFNNNDSIVMVNPDSIEIKDNEGNFFPMAKTFVSVDGYFSSNTFTPKVGNTYYMKVVYRGQTYTAQSTMQPKVEVDSLYSWTFFGSKDNEKLIAARINDPASQNNYYRYYVENLTKNTSKDFQYVFEDRLINGSKFSLTANNQFVRKGDSVAFYLLTIDKPNFTYWTVLLQNSTLVNNQAAAPANPSSNISGGCYGYFSAHSVSKRMLKVE
jgi:hypothetical protein